MYEWLERRLFRTKWAPPLATVLLIITLNSFLLFFAQLLHTQKTGGRSLLDINLIQKRAMAGVGVLSADHIDWTDNLASTSFADSLIPEPIDIVYTWVNGSDPRQMDGTGYSYLNHAGTCILFGVFFSCVRRVSGVFWLSLTH
jgi:hypothetical protein